MNSTRASEGFQEATTNMVRELRKIDEQRFDERKVDPPPEWEQSMSFDAWSRSVLIWAEIRAKPQRKAQVLIELLKKEKKKGVKDIVISEIVENREFDYKDDRVIEHILEKIKEFLEESEWSRKLVLAKEFENFSQKEGESNKDFIGRFVNLETKLRNEKVCFQLDG